MNHSRTLRYLLAEDNMDHAELIADGLKESNPGCTVEHVVDGEKALALLRKKATHAEQANEVPDIIMLDLKMPRLNGIDTLAALKADELLRHIPVVVISTSRTEVEIRRCYELGASSYITKPMRLEEMTNKIATLNLYWSVAAELPAVNDQ
ncbi:MAG: response regulator [Gammaproteobacteria bacterium]|nr:response regulator [Gammaproteobacteria bacterium]